MNEVESVIVRQAKNEKDRERAFAVRSIVFQTEQGVPADLEFDLDDETALHAIAEAHGEVVGTGRIVLRNDQAKIGRMAVLAPWRGLGVGRRLLDFLIQTARRQTVPRVVLNAQTRAIGFYAKAGFVVVGEEFDDAGIPHRRMEKPLREEDP